MRFQTSSTARLLAILVIIVLLAAGAGYIMTG
jgi:hypothetical protein